MSISEAYPSLDHVFLINNQLNISSWTHTQPDLARIVLFEYAMYKYSDWLINALNYSIVSVKSAIWSKFASSVVF